ncbi:hypothetical protein N0V82_007069 [Gnomoniopsis sp. IMI 355080]|nr:hypothetical protein N0V82_007069 [Gnomoniopsis sp. IMI 355080]
MAAIDSISTWQHAVSVEDAEVEPISLLHVFRTCSELYLGILDDFRDRTSIGRSTFISLERGHSYLLLWADGYGVTDGSVEKSLEKSKRVKQATFRLLVSISRALTNKLLPLLTEESRSNLDAKANALTQATDRLRCLDQRTGLDESDTDSDSDGDAVSEVNDLQEIAEDLRTDTQCLLDLGARFDEPAIGTALNTECTVQPALARTWDPSLNFVERIQWRYPKCDEQVSMRLGKVNWVRVMNYQEAKGRRQRERLEEAWSSVPGCSDRPLSSRGALTTLHDSGIGTSIPSNTSLVSGTRYAETTVSYHTGHGGSVKVPPIPKTAKQGVPFECVACGRMVSIKTISAWKRHLFEDLQPYLCLDEACRLKEAPFPTKAQWETHFALDHARPEDCPGIVCPICQATTPDGRAHVMSHLAKHMEEIALTILPINADSEDGTDADSGLASDASSSPGSDVSLSAQERRSTCVRPLSNEDTVGQESQWGEQHLSQTLLSQNPDIAKMDRAAPSSQRLLEEEEGRINTTATSLSSPGMMAPGKGIPASLSAEFPQWHSIVPSDVDRTSSIRKHKCPYCEVQFSRHDFLKTHLLIHSQEKPYLCEVCKLRFRRLHDLKRHGKLHTGERQLRFRRLHDLKRHGKLHTGERQIDPDLPGGHVLPESLLAQNPAASSSQGLLEEEEKGEHKSSATNESTVYLDAYEAEDEQNTDSIMPTTIPNKCKEPGCNKEFRQARELRKHEKLHTRPWKCPVPTCKYHEHGWPTEKEMERHLELYQD